jgi:hypothetical protein
MDRIIRYAAYAACVLQAGAVIVILSHAYSPRDFFLALLLTVLPALAAVALYAGPDLEERYLRRRVEKLRLQIELKELEAKAGES